MNATLLLAAGDAWGCDAAQRFFSDCGFKVHTASGGLDCWAEVQALQPDVVVVELDMPWGDADRLIALLNGRRGLPRVPVVLVLGGAPAETLSQRTGVPPSCCFQKPVRMESLLDPVGLALALRDLRLAEDLCWHCRAGAELLDEDDLCLAGEG